MRATRWAAAALLLVVLVGCAARGKTTKSNAQAAAVGGSVMSEAPRDPSPRVPPKDVRSLVDGNTAFAFDLYRELRGEKGNLFLSPYSISIALAMTYAGARGETESKMARTLHFGLPQGRLHPAFNSLDQTLASRGRGAAGTRGRGFELNVVNALWGNTGFPLLPEFLDTLARNYGAGVNQLDFGHGPEGARAAINQWVADQTKGRIQNLVPPSMTQDTPPLILTDAVYFNAAWAEPFHKEMDCAGEFNLLNGSKVGLEMMQQTSRFPYGEGNGYRVLEMPYSGNEMSMVFLVPDRGRFESFENSLNAKRAQAILAYMNEQTVHLTMPKFKYESSFALKKTLSALGMSGAFAGANFSGMAKAGPLWIEDVAHKALVSVDEEGTEAAAATAVGMGGGAYGGRQIVELTIDRPFVFLILDRGTGTVVFLGRVLDPRAG